MPRTRLTPGDLPEHVPQQGSPHGRPRRLPRDQTTADPATTSLVRHVSGRQVRHRVPSRPRAATVLVLVAAALAVGLTACTDEPDLDAGPPAPVTAATPAPTKSLPAAGEPVITIVPTAEQFAGDPAIAGFTNFVQVSALTLQSSGTDPEASYSLLAGPAAAGFRKEIADYQQNGWRLVGTPRWQIVGLQTIDDSHRRIFTCEYDAASYRVDREGTPVSQVENVWNAGQAWMVLVGGSWLLEGAYSADHDCQEFS